MKKAKLFSLLFLSLVNYSLSAFSAKQIEEVNYFSSLRSSETNVRSGPGQNYPIKYTFKLKGIPIRVVSEYDNWNEIEDYEGQKGWVTQTLITKRRTVMVFSKKKSVDMYTKNNEKSRTIFHIENFVIGDYISCIKEWCNVKFNDKKGWIKRSELYGVEGQSEEKVITEEEK